MVKTKFNKIFGKCRIVGFAGNRNSGKTNALVSLINDLRKNKKVTPIYLYGFQEDVVKYLVRLGNVFVVSELRQLIGKSNAIFILDEFQKLHLNDRKQKDLMISFVSMIYHHDNNNYAVLCSPSLREYNSIIGGYIEKWVVKSINFTDLINGSQLKKAVESYKGQYKQMDDIIVPVNKMLMLGGEVEEVLHSPYVKEVDLKRNIVSIL